jgi:predicted secreted protein
MLKRILFLSLWMIIAVFGGERFGLCQVKAQSAPRVFTLSEKDNGRKIALRKSDILVLKLQAQFGTGYSWQVAANNNKRLQLLRQSVQKPDKNSESGFETQIFRFKAKQAGQVELELRYVRVWEKEAQALKTFRLKLQIGKS